MSNKNLSEKIHQNQKLYNLKAIKPIIASERVNNNNNSKNVKDMKNHSSKKSISFMAFGKGTKVDSNANVSYDIYRGIGNMRIVAINPNKSEIAELTGRNLNEEPVYTYNRDGVKSARVEFYLKSDIENAPLFRLNIFVSNELQENRDKTKAVLIDEFANYSEWMIDKSQMNNARIRKADGSGDYALRMSMNRHIARRGETDIMNIIRQCLNMRGCFSYNQNTKEWFIDETRRELDICCVEDAEWNALVNEGDVKFLREALIENPNANDVKCVVYVSTRTSQDGTTNQFHNVFHTVMNAKANNYEIDHVLANLANESQRQLDNGNPPYEFAKEDLKVRELTADDLHASMIPDNDNGNLPF